jgi:tRNA pseudouridine55 synthase
VRAGETVVLEERSVRVERLSWVGRDVEAGSIDIELDVGKGYYVRALARDLGMHLGIPAHLSRLRRMRSGHFFLAQAIDLHAATAGALIATRDAAVAALGSATLTPEGVARARSGGPMQRAHFRELPAAGAPRAWLSPEGELVAIGSSGGDGPRVVRGFRHRRDDAERGSA